MFVANHVVRPEKCLCSLLNIDSVCIIFPRTGKNVTTCETFFNGAIKSSVSILVNITMLCIYWLQW